VNRAEEQLVYQILGEIVKKRRKDAKMKQEVLAGLVHLSRVSIVNIEKGRHHPQLHVLYELAAALRCTPSDLLPPVESFAEHLPSDIAKKLRKEEKPAVAQLISMARQGGKQ
jgi:transcriptional regulator with XRE-family HTH domain